MFQFDAVEFFGDKSSIKYDSLTRFELIHHIFDDSVSKETIANILVNNLDEKQFRSIIHYGIEKYVDKTNNFEIIHNIHDKFESSIETQDRNINKNNNATANTTTLTNTDITNITSISTNNSTQTPRTQNSTSKVFSISSLLCKIFQYLNFQSLIKYRLVNTTWLYHSYYPSSVTYLNIGNLFDKNIIDKQNINELLRFRNISSIKIQAWKNNSNANKIFSHLTTFNKLRKICIYTGGIDDNIVYNNTICQLILNNKNNNLENIDIHGKPPKQLASCLSNTNTFKLSLDVLAENFIPSNCNYDHNFINLKQLTIYIWMYRFDINLYNDCIKNAFKLGCRYDNNNNNNFSKSSIEYLKIGVIPNNFERQKMLFNHLNCIQFNNLKQCDLKDEFAVHSIKELITIMQSLDVFVEKQTNCCNCFRMQLEMLLCIDEDNDDWKLWVNGDITSESNVDYMTLIKLLSKWYKNKYCSFQLRIETFNNNSNFFPYDEDNDVYSEKFYKLSKLIYKHTKWIDKMIESFNKSVSKYDDTKYDSLIDFKKEYVENMHGYGFIQWDDRVKLGSTFSYHDDSDDNNDNDSDDDSISSQCFPFYVDIWIQFINEYSTF